MFSYISGMVSLRFDAFVVAVKVLGERNHLQVTFCRYCAFKSSIGANSDDFSPAYTAYNYEVEITLIEGTKEDRLFTYCR